MIKGKFSDKGPWTLFWDMSSGGSTKEGKFEKIYVQLPQKEAEIFFYNRFGHNPNRVSCTCCGSDYSISEDATFAEASDFHRNAIVKDGKEKPTDKSYGVYRTVETYIEEKHVLVICKNAIEPHETVGEVPEQGYVWKD